MSENELSCCKIQKSGSSPEIESNFLDKFYRPKQTVIDILCRFSHYGYVSFLQVQFFESHLTFCPLMLVFLRF